MNKHELTALAERVEAAEAGEQRDLLIEAFALVFPDHYTAGRSGIGPNRWHRFKRMLDAEAYESAALTLVPEGCQWGVDSHYNMARVNRYWMPCHADDDGHCEFKAEAATPALALVAAALRSQAQGEGGSNG